MERSGADGTSNQYIVLNNDLPFWEGVQGAAIDVGILAWRVLREADYSAQASELDLSSGGSTTSQASACLAARLRLS